MRVPIVTSHAACAGHAPENTLAGIRRALELGADAIEIDVHVTADGVPVLLHDDHVDRTTDGHGEITGLTLAEARRLDAGARQHEGRFAGERIPTLAEVLDLTKGRCLLVIEVKQAGIEERVLEVVRAANALNECEAHSFKPGVVAKLRSLEPRLPCALLTDGLQVKDWGEFFAFALSLNVQGVSVGHWAATPEVVRRGQLRSLTFFTWTADDEADVRRLLDCGVDGITTNFPDRVRRVIAEVVRGRREG